MIYISSCREYFHFDGFFSRRQGPASLPCVVEFPSGDDCPARSAFPFNRCHGAGVGMLRYIARVRHCGQFHAFHTRYLQQMQISNDIKIIYIRVGRRIFCIAPPSFFNLRSSIQEHLKYNKTRYFPQCYVFSFSN